MVPLGVVSVGDQGEEVVNNVMLKMKLVRRRKARTLLDSCPKEISDGIRLIS